MACRTETKTIGERECSATQWSAEKAILMKLKLAKAFGPALLSLVNNDNESDVNLVDSISLLFATSSPEECFALLKETLMGVAINDKRLTSLAFNEVFDADNLFDVYKIFIFVLQVNYGNLLKGQWAESLLVKIEEHT